MTTSISAGTVTVANGGTTVTGTDTFWIGKVFEGDLFTDPAQGLFVRVTADATSNTALSINAWPGTVLVDAAYEVILQSDSIRMSERTRQLLEALSLVEPNYDAQVADLPGRAAYDDELGPSGGDRGFAVLVSDVGDGRAAIYSKLSNASGDWSDPAYLTGPVGPEFDVVVGTVTTGAPGTNAAVVPTPTPGGVSLAFTLPAGRGVKYTGAYSPAASYVRDDAALDGGSTWILTAAASTGNAPPTLPTTSNAQWSLLSGKGNDGGGEVINTAQPCGRPSLVSGVAVPSADVVGATSIYYVPCTGSNLVPIYDLVEDEFIPRSIGSQLSLALDPDPAHFLYQSPGAYDLFIIYHAGTPKLCSGFPWASNGGSATARGTGVNSTDLEFFRGVWVNKNSTWVRLGSAESDILEVPARTALAVGSFFAVANGQTMDTADNRLVATAYNPAIRRLRKQDTGLWDRTTGVFGIANGNAGNRVAVLSFMSGAHVSLRAVSMAYNSTATERTCAVAIANDADTIPDECAMGWFGTAASPAIRSGFADYEGQPGLGLRYLKWFERGNGTDTQTFFGSTAQSWQTGLIGSVLM